MCSRSSLWAHRDKFPYLADDAQAGSNGSKAVHFSLCPDKSRFKQVTAHGAEAVQVRHRFIMAACHPQLHGGGDGSVVAAPSLVDGCPGVVLDGQYGGVSLEQACHALWVAVVCRMVQWLVVRLPCTIRSRWRWGAFVSSGDAYKQRSAMMVCSSCTKPFHPALQSAPLASKASMILGLPW